MNLTPWRKSNVPAHRANTLQSEFNRFFDDVFGGWPASAGFGEMGWAPSVAMTENTKRVTVTAEVPGMEADDVEINVHNNVLVIRGEKKHEKTEEDGSLVRNELYHGSFMRQVALPCEVDSAHAEATLKKGVLTLKLPKVAAAKGTSIKIK